MPAEKKGNQRITQVHYMTIYNQFKLEQANEWRKQIK